MSELIDSIEGLYNGRGPSEHLYVTYNVNNEKYSLQSHITDLGGTYWDFHFFVSKATARAVISRGFAHWWHTVDASRR